MPVTVLSDDTNVGKTVGHMQRQIIKAAGSKQIQDLAKIFLMSPVPEKAAFNYVYRKVVYVPDPMDYQDIRTPQRSLRDRAGNCVDYTVFIGALLQAMAIPFRIKVVEIEENEGYEHVYITTDKYVLDPCIGQPQDGTAKNARPYTGKFNKETFFFNHKYFDMPKLRLLQGSARTSRSIKIAKLTNSRMPMSEYMAKSGHMGILCLKNCACKNDCTSMFGALDTSTEKGCRQWCDDIKAKKNSKTPSRDALWIQTRDALISASVAAVPGQPPPTVDVRDESWLERTLREMAEGFTGTGNGAPAPGVPYPPAPTPTKILGLPQNTVLIGGGLIVAGIIYATTRKRRGKRK